MIEIPLNTGYYPIELKLNIKPNERVGLTVQIHSQNHLWDGYQDFTWFEEKYLSAMFKAFDLAQQAAALPLMDDSSRIDLEVGWVTTTAGRVKFSVEKRKYGVYMVDIRGYVLKDRVQVGVISYPPNGRYNPAARSHSPGKLIDMQVELCEKMKTACSTYASILPGEFYLPDFDALINRLIEYKSTLDRQCTEDFDK